MTPSQRYSLGYIPALDGLRAIAVTLVVAHHAVTPLAPRGYAGVDVFFVISGYLITAILLREIDRNRSIRFGRFYLRRFIRLYPPLIITAAVVAIPGVILASSGWGHIRSTIYALLYITPITAQFNSASAGVWAHTWSLGIEEMYYLVWPALLILAVRSGMSRVAMACIAAGCGVAMLGVFAATDAMFWPSFMRAGGIFLGCALALVLHNHTVRVPRILGWIALFVLLWVVIAGIPGLRIGGVIGVVVSASLVLIAVSVSPHRGESWSLVLGNRVMAYIGQISYELYLWHYVILSLGMWAAGRTATMTDVAWWAIPLSFGMAAATHKVVVPLQARLRARLAQRDHTDS